MECRLQYAPSWSCKVVLRFHFDSLGKPLPEVREVPFGSMLTNKTEVEDRLRRAQRAILCPTLAPEVFLTGTRNHDTTHVAQTFSQNCVCIRVAGPKVPDLFFFDLPGKTRSLPIPSRTGEPG